MAGSSGESQVTLTGPFYVGYQRSMNLVWGVSSKQSHFLVKGTAAMFGEECSTTGWACWDGSQQFAVE